MGWDVAPRFAALLTLAFKLGGAIQSRCLRGKGALLAIRSRFVTANLSGRGGGAQRGSDGGYCGCYFSHTDGAVRLAMVRSNATTTRFCAVGPI